MPRLALLAVIAGAVLVRVVALRRVDAGEARLVVVVLGVTLVAVVLAILLAAWVATTSPLAGGLGLVATLAVGGAWLRTTLDRVGPGLTAGGARPGRLGERLVRASGVASVALLGAGFVAALGVVMWLMGRMRF